MSYPAAVQLQRPPEERAVVHPEVDRAFIGRLVREFYGRVRRNDRLGPIFAAHIGETWEPHLEKMTDFWCAVMFKNGAYSGRPVPAHLKLKQVQEEDFDIWLDIHGNLGVTDAVSYGRLLAEYRPFFYEEPVETTNPATLKKVSETPEWKSDSEKNYWTDEYVAGAGLKKLLDQDYAESRAVLTELGLAK